MAATEQDYQAFLDTHDKSDPDYPIFEQARDDARSQRGLSPVRAPLADKTAIDKVPTEKLGVIDSIKEGFTGERRKTAETTALPDYSEIPELGVNFSDLGKKLKVAAGTVMGSPEEMAKIISAQFPRVQTRTDEKGNMILRSGINNQEYAIKPGFEAGDLARGATAAGLFSLTKGKSLPGMMAKSGGTQLGYEGLQKLVGGNFNPEDVAIASGMPVVGTALKMGLGAIGSRLADAFPLVKQGAEAATVGAEAVYSKFKDMFPRMFDETTTPGSKINNPNLSAEETADLAKKAAKGDTGAMRLLAEDVAPDDKTLEAAKRLGIEQYLQPDHVTTSQTFRELAQLAKSQPGSVSHAEEIKGLTKIGERAFNLVDEMGGTSDLSTLNINLRNRMMATAEELRQTVDNAWTTLRATVGNTTPTTARNAVEMIEKTAAELGGEENLSPLEKHLLEKLRPKPIMQTVGEEEVQVGLRDPTFALVDTLRREVGRATKSMGAFGTEDTGKAKQLYKALLQDVSEKAAGSGDAGKEAFNLAFSATRLQKSMQDDLTSLFGRDVDKSMTKSLTAAITGLSRGDADSFVKLMGSIPPEQRKEAAASGVTAAFGKATTNGDLNFNTYMKWYEGLLRNRTAYKALMGNLPEGAQKQFSDLYRVSRGVTQSTREYIRTGKALSQGMADTDTVIQRLYGIGQRAAVGVPLEMAATAAGFPGAGIASGVTSALIPRSAKPAAITAVDAMLASPQFRQMIESAGTKGEQAASLNLTKSKPFVQFSKAIKTSFDKSVPQSDIDKFVLSVFQAAGQGNRPDKAPAIEKPAPVPAPPVPAPTAAMPPPQAMAPPRAMAPATPTRGIAAINPAAAAPTGGPPPPQASAGLSSKDLYRQLFPLDMA